MMTGEEIIRELREELVLKRPMPPVQHWLAADKYDTMEAHLKLIAKGCEVRMIYHSQGIRLFGVVIRRITAKYDGQPGHASAGWHPDRDF